MAGTKNSRQRKSSSFSLFSMFSRGRSSSHSSSSSTAGSYNTRKVGSSDPWGEEVPRPVRRVYPSDEDRRLHNWVAKPGIDRMATDFIAKFHEARMSEAQTMAIPNN